MKENQQRIDEGDYSENESAVMAQEKSLILLETKPEKNLDQTISNPDRYLSRYQYNTKNIDKYITLCPHCKKPTLSAFEKSANPAEQSLALVKMDPTFLAHLEELEEQAESVERLAEWIKDYIVGRGLIDQGMADQADWLSPTKMLTSG